MTVLLVVVFLPSTVVFRSESDASSASNNSPSAKSGTIPQDHCSHKEHAKSGHGRSHSLQNIPTYVQTRSNRPAPMIATTPGATTTIDNIFLPNNNLSVSINLPGHGIVRNKSSASLHSLSAMEPQRANWGQAVDSTQPDSLAQSPPPQSIFDDRASQKNAGLLESIRPSKTEVSRPKKKEISYTTTNYTVQPSTIGNAGLHAAIQAVSAQKPDVDVCCVGTLGMPTDALTKEVKDHIANKLEVDHDSLVVFVNDTEINAHYENYCKVILWPMFHSQIPDVPMSKAYQDNSWEHYVNVNAAFADCVVKNYRNEDVILVNDYHLLLLPDMVRKQLPHAKIALFIHSAFPPSEIFRCLPSRYELIEGMLGANMIAFQSEDYRYQFLQTCSRLLNIEAAEHGLVLENGRYIDVFAIPMGIDVSSLNLRRQLPEVGDRMLGLSERFAGKRVIVARDKLDVIHGLKQKLRGFADFLVRYPEWVGKVVLVQIATSSGRNRDLIDNINNTIMDINADYGDLDYQPIVFLNQDIDYSQYLALLSIADCMLVTSLSEGMNLTCHEFVVCQDGTSGSKGFAPLIVSEFIGAASVFDKDALHVNPWHPKGIAMALDKALKMTYEDRKWRWENMHGKTKEHGALQWFDTFVEKLDHAWKEHSARDPSVLPRLKMKELRQKYDQSARRLFLIDLEGTLTDWGSPRESVVTMPKKTIDFLADLVADSRNTVYLMSQHGRSALTHMFRDISDFKLGLIAENGAFIRKPGEQEWKQVVDFDLNPWKAGVMDMLKHYQGSVRGSFVEELESGMAFHYYDAEDKQDARNKVGEIANQINEMCSGQGVAAIPIEKCLLVSPSEINKATAAKSIQADLLKKGQASDFVFVVGDSNDDECVFTWAQELPGCTKIEKDQITTCIVGRRSTTAAYGIGVGINSVVSKLEKLVLAEGSKAA